MNAAVAMPPRAESDKLPSAISMVQHTSDGTRSSLRLCSVNVERGAAGERVYQQLLGGHGTDGVSALLPHPTCSLLTSCDAGGEVMLWEASAFSCREAPRVPPS